MRLPSILFLMALLGWTAASGQSTKWDPENAETPSTSSFADQPLRQPTKIKPFSIVLFRACEPLPDGTVSYTGRLGIEILSEYGAVGFESLTVDSLVIITIRTRPWAVKFNSVLFPKDRFQLHVILGRDTAKFRVVHDSSLTVDYYQPSPLLRILEARQLPPRTFCLQCTGNKKEASKTMDLLTQQSGNRYSLIALPDGFYSCLPAPDVGVTSLARKKTINKTSLGYLLCAKAATDNDVQSLKELIITMQLEEFRKYQKTQESKNPNHLQKSR